VCVQTLEVDVHLNINIDLVLSLFSSHVATSFVDKDRYLKHTSLRATTNVGSGKRRCRQRSRRILALPFLLTSVWHYMCTTVLEARMCDISAVCIHVGTRVMAETSTSPLTGVVCKATSYVCLDGCCIYPSQEGSLDKDGCAQVSLAVVVGISSDNALCACAIGHYDQVSSFNLPMITTIKNPFTK
jgi:hypothetical protein